MPPDQLGEGLGGGGGPSIDVGGRDDGSGLLDTALKGISDILTGTLTTAAGNLLGGYLSKLLIDLGVPAQIAGSFSATLSEKANPWLNLGPSYRPGVDTPLIGGWGGPGLGLPVPYDIGNILGFGDIGAIGAIQRSGLSGQFAGELLKGKKIKVSDLLAHQGNTPGLLERVAYGLVG